MAQTVAPFLLKNLTLTLKKLTEPDGTPAVGGTATEYRCQLNIASLTPSAGGAGEQTFDTFCESFTNSSASGATWVLNLGGFQAYADVADLSVILFNDEGATYEFVLTPTGGTISATNPGFQGVVTMFPSIVGGTANTYATFTVDLSCTGKPTMITTAPVLREGEEDTHESVAVEEDTHESVSA